MDDDESKGKDRDKMSRFNDLLDLSSTGQTGGGWMKLQSELTWKPPLDVVETDREIVVLVDIAGINGKDINVVTDGETLRISGIRKNIGPPGEKQFHNLEIQVGPFERVVTLPVPVDRAAVSARYTDGLLTIRVRKVDRRGGEHRIEID
ncbi:MAG: Hsp20/alpha crystallin family protein [bacterium]|nr:MAG: Hsp20/alpha crystallin family protein [bacterium]